MYIYILHNIYIYHENNVSSRLSPQWLCGNSCTWVHIYIYITPILLLWDLSTLCVVHVRSLTYLCKYI